MPGSYLLCGTPRTGSTLLCALLTSTGVAGRPESYFREPDEPAWARRFGIPVAADGSFDYRRFARAARAAGSTPNGVFAARVMWGTVPRIVGGLEPGPRTRPDLEVLTDAFGPLRMVHLRREDVLGQAVSWARAEQTGYWQEGDRAGAEPRLDLSAVEELVRAIEEHDAAWTGWFAEQGVVPHRVTYEEVTADPDRAVRGVLGHLDLEPPADWRPAPRQRRQADETNAAWVRAYREANPGA
ncbi:MAG TPA: Stf0 family sulfotransferase [Mycobacteriales bacterium]